MKILFSALLSVFCQCAVADVLIYKQKVSLSVTGGGAIRHASLSGYVILNPDAAEEIIFVQADPKSKTYWHEMPDGIFFDVIEGGGGKKYSVWTRSDSWPDQDGKSNVTIFEGKGQNIAYSGLALGTLKNWNVPKSARFVGTFVYRSGSGKPVLEESRRSIGLDVRLTRTANLAGDDIYSAMDRVRVELASRGYSDAAFRDSLSASTLTTNISTLSGVLALSYMPSGTVAYVAPGFYNLGTNNIVPPVGVSVIGAGSHLVTFYGYSDCWGVESTGLSSGGPQYNPRDNSVHQGFRLLLDVTNMMSAFTNSPSRHSGMWSGFGCSDPNPPANKSFTNVVARDIVVEGGWFDAFHHNPFTRCQARYEYCRARTGGGTWNFRAGTVGNTAADSHFELVSCVAISSGDAPAINAAAFAAADQSFIDSAYPVVLNGCFGHIKSNNIYHISGGGGMFGSDTELVVNGGKYHSNIPTDRSFTNAVGRFSFNDRIIIRN